ncbi:MAG: hypothetical protein IKB86_00285 [Clostridia bacterium]|nr:hypothetical protein [Clostridia bacterium]
MKKLALFTCLIMLFSILFTGCEKGKPNGDEGLNGSGENGAKDFQSAIASGDYEAALDAVLSGDATATEADKDKFLVLPTEIDCTDRYGKYKATFTYDDGGLLTSFEKLRENDPEKYVFTYNENRKITSIHHYLGKNNPDPSVYTYTYDEKGNLLIEDSKYRSGRNVTITYTYDENNRIATATETTKEVAESPGTLFFKYTYDENGNLLSRLREAEDNGVIYFWGEQYTYDEQNRITVKQECHGDYGVRNKYTYTYDENGLLIKERWDSVSDADWWTEKTYTYDSNGTQYVKTYSDGGDEEAYVYSYEFDDQGKLTKKTYHERDDKETRVSTFDTAGNIISIHRTKEDGSVDSTYTYAFDKYGNKTKEILSEKGTTTYSYSVTYQVKYYENGAPELPTYLRQFREADSIYSFL